MNKDQKTAVVEELSKELTDADAVFAIDYRGISVPQAAELREGLREADTRFRVVKNRLTLLAADKAGTAELKEHLEGPTALAFVKGDPALAAKTIFRLGSEWEVLDYKGGLMEGEVLDEDSFKTIAKLPGRDQLNAQFAGIVASPITGLVRGLGSMVQGLASQLQQIADQGLVTGEPPKEPNTEAPQTGTPGGEAEDVPADGEAEQPAADNGGPDPEPSESPEEEPSEEKAPEGEEAGGETQVPETGEGEAEPGSTEEKPAEQETSEDSDDENKEDK